MRFHGPSKSTACRLEALEARRLLAAVSWDGEAGDNLWHTALNWSNNAVPTAADDVTIDVAGEPIVTFDAVTGVRAVNSLVSHEALIFTGGSLAVAATADINAAISMSGASLLGGSWDVTGAVGGGIAVGAAGATFSAALISGDIVLNAPNSHTTVSLTTRFTAVRLSATNSSVRLAPGYVLRDKIFAEGAAAGLRTIQLASPGNLTVAHTGLIHHAIGCGGGLEFSNSGGAMALINEGTIANEASGRTTSIVTASFGNRGLISGVGGEIFVAAEDWDNVGGSIYASGGDFVIGGSFDTTSGTGLIVNSGGMEGGVFVVGTVLNTGNTIALNDATLGWTMTGGTIVGGAMTLVGAAALTSSPVGGTLLDVQISGDVILEDTNARVLLSGSTRLTAVRMHASTRLDLDAGYAIRDAVILDGQWLGPRTIFQLGTGPLVIDASGSLRTTVLAQGSFDCTNAAGSVDVINRGLFNINSTDSFAFVHVDEFLNDGSVQLHSGTHSLSPRAWRNTGTITVDTGTTLSIGGSFDATQSSGNLNNNGTIVLVGNVGNAGGVFSIKQSPGIWILNGGSISGGTVIADGPELRIGASGGTLTDTSFVGDLNLNVAGAILTIAGTTRFTTVRMPAGDTVLRVGTAYTLRDTVFAEGIAAGMRTVQSVGAAWTIGAEGAVRLGAANADLRLVAGTLTNHGTIASTSADETLSIESASFLNAGVIELSGGFLTIAATNWTNVGQVHILAAATMTMGGTFTPDAETGLFHTSAGTVLVTGTIANAGHSLRIDGMTGSWRLDGGTISGGTVTTADNQGIVPTANGGTLLNVQYQGELLISTYLVVSGNTRFTTARLTAGNANIRFVAGYTLSDTVVVEGTTGNVRTIYQQGTGTLTIGPTGLVRLASSAGGALTFSSTGGSMSLVNYGTVTSESPRTISFANGSVTNLGVFRATAGTFSISLQTVNLTNYNASTNTLAGGTWSFQNASMTINGATIRTIAPQTYILIGGTTGIFGGLSQLSTNHGLLILSSGRTLAITPFGGTFTTTGTLAIDATSRLNVTGSFVQSASGDLEFTISGPTSYGRVVATGPTTISGRLSIIYANYSMTRGHTFDLVTASSVIGVFGSASIGGVQGYDRPFLRYEPGRVRLEIIAAADWDGDGFVTGLDYDLFVTLFEQGEGADFDGDGFITGLDFDLFVYAFEHG